MTSNPETTPRLTFEAVLALDEIRRENHCDQAVCVYTDGCVCWNELLEQLQNPMHETNVGTDRMFRENGCTPEGLARRIRETDERSRAQDERIWRGAKQWNAKP